MKVLSLFSGVGGFDLGLEQAGMETVFQCEYDKQCLTVLEKHWPQVPRWNDVSTLTGEYILKHAPVIDVIAWGSPCQDLSVAGKREGLEGSRSGLFHEGMRIIKELRELTNGQYPRISIWENVVGAVTSNGGNDFGVILDEMAKAGALVIEWAVLDAQHFGVPQRRRRVFVTAIFDSATASRCPNPLLPVAQGVRGDTKTRKQAREDATDAYAAGIRADDSIIGSEIVGSLNTSDAKMISSQYVNENKCVVEPYVKLHRAQSVTDNETWAAGVVNPTLNSFDMGDVRTTTTIVETFSDADEISFYDGYNQKLDSTGVHRSLRSNRDSGDFVAQPTESKMTIRRLTPLECERLNGWPDEHTRWEVNGKEQSDTTRYKQCGNGVASPVAAWIGKQVVGL
jgi:DNA (cytosine-5)-methyltransferase 1